MTKHIVVVGAGPGGLASAMLLAGRGYKVEVYEKQPYVGGRTSALKRDGFTFDRGPTFLSMPYILEELFDAVGRKLSDYLDLIRVDPMYELRFKDVVFSPSDDFNSTFEQIRTLFPGDEEGYKRFMIDTKRKMQALLPVLQNRHGSLLDYARWRTIKALPELSLNQTLYEVLDSYFSDERLKLSFTFQSKYLGMSPWECPGAFSILSYMEHEYGVWHPRGGLNQISEAMAEVIEEYGGKVHTNTPVKQILTKNASVYGLELEDGEVIECDELIINADFAYAMTELLSESHLKQHTKAKLDKKKYSCSSFMMYVGLDTQYDLAHHTVIFSDDYKRNVEEITKSKTLSADPSIYVQNPIVTDPSLAPEGKSGLYILAPVPNNFSLLDWEKHKHEFRDLIYEILEQKSEFKDLREHIVFEELLTPDDWQKNHNIYQGATFNLAHNLGQMMYFRPHNQFQELDHCWLVGGGTHPGSGLPTIFESARITANSLMDADKKGLYRL
ncbi:phytoene desaturase family protein [Alkalicoccobacillus murimartini]|uniref:Phytoene desaturase n=1 Tax=Alkalicoccobacillus murimartini TaxID=171685 RepID=A0ABT9YD11_9BACI|nr:phytoene desaturase family protein [Alkalicoccobacillus murimartini]MDQ0205747.1 phytoene desaturase [Alkalicoccobacillus murimartini]